ncbi:37S ribosomal protein S22 [Toensbergia leucococca]|nr:37S ribosomal protein S22 [Toensbergia leucococca]
MQASRISQNICGPCKSRLITLFEHGFCPTPTSTRPRLVLSIRARVLGNQQARPLAVGIAQAARVSVENDRDGPIKSSPAQMEALVRQARQTFGETLPGSFLSPEEYAIYERLYGSPIKPTRPEDIRLLQDMGENLLGEEEKDIPRKSLSWENDDGNLKEVEYDLRENNDGNCQEAEYEQEDGQISDVSEGTMEEADRLSPKREENTDFRARMMLYQDMVAASQVKPLGLEKVSILNGVEDNIVEEADEAQEEMDSDGYDDEELEELDESENAYESSDAVRTHPLTVVGRFGTSPATLNLPKETLVDPVTSLLADSSNKHLTEVALRVFGGLGLPNSTATPLSKRHLKQHPIALEASQFKMGDMEANVYLAAIMPGAYATVVSTLVEIRKRLGSSWLGQLLKKDGGPRVLDAGAGGAGVLAWREIVRAEWESSHSDGVPNEQPTPFGKATVIAGSSVLRHRASRLLDNTTFLPRLPDYVPLRDPPSVLVDGSQSRTHYDVIIAPYTLWTLKEDYIRKAQVQNLWSLLNPDGGVLILIEKGVPRGFELIAGARELLLKNNIASPEKVRAKSDLHELSNEDFTTKDNGMIIAPCTNHSRCPMYLVQGRSKDRKFYCHFSQRYVRPPYLQRILGSKDRNHEDIQFSYVAVQRGRDQRQTHGIVQGDPATEAAFVGYEGEEILRDKASGEPSQKPDFQEPVVNALGLPRNILPPLKRRGHVILDVCTPAGQIERWTVPKSFSKQAYRDARKSRWGDLWALGAKTRILRTIKPVTDKAASRPRGKTVVNVDTDRDEEMEDFRDLSKPEPTFHKNPRNNRKNRKDKKPKTLNEDDF